MLIVVQGSEHDRITGVIVQKSHQHLIIQFRNKEDSGGTGGIKMCEHGPDTLAGRLDGWYHHFYPVLTERVLIDLLDDADMKSGHGPHPSVCIFP